MTNIVKSSIYEELSVQERSINQTGGVVVEEIDLSTLTASGEAKIDRACWGVYYDPRGSARGGVLHCNVGGEARNFGPGDWIKGKIEWFALRRGKYSATTGVARLLLFTSPVVEFGNTVSDPVPAFHTDLLGNMLAGTFVNVDAATTPDGTWATMTNAFDCSGWRKIRVLVDAQTAGGTALTWDFVPWWSTQDDSRWYSQETERVSVSNDDGTGARYRVLILDVAGRGHLFLAVENITGAGATGVGLIVQGIE